MPSRVSLFSLTGLLVWAFGVVRLGALALVLVAGPQLEDFAWDHGTHVTPAQAAMHNMLMAEGIAHHHHPLPPSATRQAPLSDGSGVAVQAGDPTMTFGSPFSTVTIDVLVPPAFSLVQTIPASDAQRLLSHLSGPDSPPPKALQAFSFIA